jgi:prepilin-type N-terminal cleavage/methylation domain-containing protein/prepilin-type processing-associated H-X9-DG protein
MEGKMSTQRCTWLSMNAAGFTLMELLVVISIIALLMSILLPGLTGARQQGKRVVCLANMWNLTEGWIMYAFDYDDKLCSADTDWDVPPANHWVADGPVIPSNDIGGTKRAIENGVFWPYTEQTLDLYRCKSDSSGLLRSYCISRAMNGKTCNCEHDNINPFRTYSTIRRPSEKMVFVDAGSRMEWIEGSFCPVEQIDAVPPKWFCRLSRNITARHSDGCNLSFADAHCAYFKYKDPRTIELADWQIGPDEASEDNPDLERMVQLLQGRRD